MPDVTSSLATLGTSAWNVNNSFTANSLNYEQPASPTAGSTVQVATRGSGVDLWLTPAGTLATLTIALPSEANSFMGQRISFGSTQTVTTLTISGATTIYNAPSSLNPGDFFVLKKVAANTWAKEE